ncbi:hypothetical protein U9M48_029865 [Paspalum notatum var. saurae]|uniref:Uncharacterized protein n=1 Tax=Paspalum notatum var. saurae TaxID=547442 RepID=A0AAQ3X221_PASNO
MWKRATSLLRHHRSALGPRSPAASSAATAGLGRTPSQAPLFFSTLGLGNDPSRSSSQSDKLRWQPRFDGKAALRFSSDAAGTRTRVEDVMPIATGLEREEIEAELQGKKRFDMDAPVGPFGTKEAPAVIQSYYNKRIVGCSGGEGVAIDFLQKMNMMWCGFGWRKASHMNAQSAPNISRLMLLEKEDPLMDMMTMMTTTIKVLQGMAIKYRANSILPQCREAVENFSLLAL